MIKGKAQCLPLLLFKSGKSGRFGGYWQAGENLTADAHRDQPIFQRSHKRALHRNATADYNGP